MSERKFVNVPSGMSEAIIRGDTRRLPQFCCRWPATDVAELDKLAKKTGNLSRSQLLLGLFRAEISRR